MRVPDARSIAKSARCSCGKKTWLATMKGEERRADARCCVSSQSARAACAGCGGCPRLLSPSRARGARTAAGAWCPPRGRSCPRGGVRGRCWDRHTGHPRGRTPRRRWRGGRTGRPARGRRRGPSCVWRARPWRCAGGCGTVRGWPAGCLGSRCPSGRPVGDVSWVKRWAAVRKTDHLVGLVELHLDAAEVGPPLFCRDR